MSKRGEKRNLCEEVVEMIIICYFTQNTCKVFKKYLWYNIISHRTNAIYLKTTVDINIEKMHINYVNRIKQITSTQAGAELRKQYTQRISEKWAH